MSFKCVNKLVNIEELLPIISKQGVRVWHSKSAIRLAPPSPFC